MSFKNFVDYVHGRGKYERKCGRIRGSKKENFVIFSTLFLKQKPPKRN